MGVPRSRALITTIASVSEFERFIEQQDAAARQAQLERDKQAEKKSIDFARNEQLLAEFIASMTKINAELTTIEVLDTRTEKQWVKTGWFAREEREIVTTTKAGLLSFWPGPSAMSRIFVCPDGLVWWEHGDSYWDRDARIPVSMSAGNLASHRLYRDFQLGRRTPEDLGAQLAATYRSARR